MEDGGPLPPEGSEYARVIDQFWIVETQNVDWTALGSVFGTMMTGDDDLHGFVLFEPWVPGLGMKVEGFRTTFEGAEDIQGVQWATAEAKPAFFEAVFRARTELGGLGSGTWLVGISRDVGRLRGLLTASGFPAGPPVFIAIDSAAALDAALAMDEGGSTQLLFRRRDPFVGRFNALLSVLPSVDRN